MHISHAPRLAELSEKVLPARLRCRDHRAKNCLNIVLADVADVLAGSLPGNGGSRGGDRVTREVE